MLASGTPQKVASGLKPLSRKLPVALLTTAALMVTVSSAHASGSVISPPVPRAVPTALVHHHAKHARHRPHGVPVRPVHAADAVVTFGGPNYLIATPYPCSSWFKASGYWWYTCTTSYSFGGTSWAHTDTDWYYFVGDPNYGRYSNTWRCVADTGPAGYATVGPTPSTAQRCFWVY